MFSGLWAWLFSWGRRSLEFGDVDYRRAGFRVDGLGDTVDDINPAVPIIRNIPQFPWFRVRKVMLRISITNSITTFQQRESHNKTNTQTRIQTMVFERLR